MESNNTEARVGKYVLVRRVAKGGMAELYLANQNGPQGFERQVAIKRILPNLTHDKSFIAMFLSEAKIAAQLAHPNIIQIYDLGKVGESYYIAMEFVDGLDLEWISGLLEREKRGMPVDFVAAVCARVSDALHYAHQQTDPEGRPLNIIHRDVTPGNVMVSFHGEVKLVDFGIAKATAQIERTGVGVVKGKFYYLSPEQTLNVPVDHRADVFSLGVTLYELTTGKRPFDGADAMSIVKAIRDVQPTSPADVVPGYPPALAKIVMKALEKDRLRRYHNAREMQADLDAYLAFLPTPYGRAEIASFMRDVAAIRLRGQGGGAAGPDSELVDEPNLPAPGPLPSPVPEPSALAKPSPLDARLDEQEPVTILSVRRPADLLSGAGASAFDPFGDDPAGVELVMSGSASGGRAVAPPHPLPPSPEGEALAFVPPALFDSPSGPRNVELPTIPGDPSPVPMIKTQSPRPVSGVMRRSSANMPKAVTPGRPPPPPAEIPWVASPDLARPPPKDRSDLVVTIVSRPSRWAITVIVVLAVVAVALAATKVLRGPSPVLNLPVPSPSRPTVTAPPPAPPLPAPAAPVKTEAIREPLGPMPAPPTESSDVPALASPRARGPLGKLTIDATPWASISMSDGKARRDLGLTPVEVEVPGGTYTLTADNAEMGKREQKKVKVKPGSVLKVRFTMNGDEP